MMTAPPPRYRFVFALTIRHSIVRGNVCAATDAAARAVIAQRYGSEAAERARVRLVEPEETHAG